MAATTTREPHRRPPERLRGRGWWRLLDPRRYLAAAIAWMVFLLAAVAGLAAAALAAGAAERQVQRGSEALLAQLAYQTRHTLEANLANRLSIVRAVAAQLETAADWSPEALRRQLQATQLEFPEFAWLGVADERGRVRAATGGLLEGQDVGARPWFAAGLQRPWLGDLHDAVLLDRLLRRDASAPALRFVDAVAPLRDEAARPFVLGGHLSWSWIEALHQDSMRALGTHDGIEILLLAADGRVLIGPPSLRGRVLGRELGAVAEGGRFIYQVAGAQPATPERPALGWSVLVRQSREAALGAAEAARRRVFLIVLLGAAMAAAMSLPLSLFVTAGLRRLAADAQGVRDGRLAAMPVPRGIDEIASIGGTLALAVQQLQQEKASLAELNARLDEKVAQRTREVEQLAQENERLAVARERLKLARDVHDSLANTLLALRNEVRLVRLLRERGSPQQVEAHLAAAEDAATRGLQEARAAITQMRHNNVADLGLGHALARLLERFSTRTGVPHRLDAEGDDRIPVEQAEAAFRIAEEALRNVERHARAGEVRVAVEAMAAGGWTLLVEDDGVGFDPSQARPGHYGVQGLHEQAAAIGARLAIDSAPGRGTRLRLSLEPATPSAAHTPASPAG